MKIFHQKKIRELKFRGFGHQERISFQVLVVTCMFQIKEKSKRKQFPILRMTKHRLISYHARSFQRIQTEINSKNKYLNRFIQKENIYIS